MNSTISPNNHDPRTNLNWYSKVNQHPDVATNLLAGAFCQTAAAWLIIPPPKLYWFEPAGHYCASHTWFDNSSRKS